MTCLTQIIYTRSLAFINTNSAKLGTTECGIEEATDRSNDASIYWARLWIKEKLRVVDSKSALQGTQLRIEWLKREKKELEDEKTRLEDENEELKRLKARLEKKREELDGEGEEWKKGITPDED